MKTRQYIAGLLFLLVGTTTAWAGPVGPWSGGWLGPQHHGFDGSHDGWFRGWDRGCFGTGEWWQDRFETRLDDFKVDYDAAVSDDPDFYASELYGDMVDRLQRYVDRYDRFVSCEESAIDRIAGNIDRINDRIDWLNQLLEEEPDDDKPCHWSEKFEEHITRKVDLLTERIEGLTEKSDALAGSLEEHTLFQEDLLAYLDEVLAAGNPPSEALPLASTTIDWPADEGVVLTLASMLPPPAAAFAIDDVGAVPEPATLALLASAVVLLGVRRSRRVAC